MNKLLFKRSNVLLIMLLACILFSTINFLLFENTLYAGSDYLARDPIYSMTDTNVNRATSEHFQIMWGKNDTTGLVNDEFIQGNLKNLEGMWDCYVNKLGMNEPGISVNEDKKGQKYKTNVYVTSTGMEQHKEGFAFMSGDGDGFGYIIVHPSAMRVDPPGWVLPHEFGHVVTMHQISWNENGITGPWWETVANWFCEQYLRSSNYQYNGKSYAPDTDFFEPKLFHLEYSSPHGRDYYHAWPILQYLTDNPDNLPGFGNDFVKKMMQQAKKDEYPYNTMKRLAPDVSFKDVLGNWAKRMATQDITIDMELKKKYQERFKNSTESIQGKYRVFSHLRKSPDKQDWWMIEDARAPQQAGMNIIKLSPQTSGNNRVITVNLAGLVDDERKSDWRACLVAVDAQGKERYSDLFGQGTGSITLSDNDKEVFLTVVATPDEFIGTSAFDAPDYSVPAKRQFPYEVKINGAIPYEEKLDLSKKNGNHHPNGGGFVEASAKVDATSYIGPDACVFGNATVQGNVRIEDYAIVTGNAVVMDNAILSGHALVADKAIIKDNAKIRDYAIVQNESEISGYGKVLENAMVDGGKVKDYAVAKGYAIVPKLSTISEEGMVDGDFVADMNVLNGTAFGWLCSKEYVEGLKNTPGLFAGYDFDTNSSLYAFDRYGTTHGIFRGSAPVFSDSDSADSSHKGIIKLNGKDQYVLLDSQVFDHKVIDIRATVNWLGGSKNQHILSFGISNDTYMYLTPMDENGKAKFEIKKANTVETMVASAPLPEKQWCEVRLVLNENSGKLFINNQLVVENTNMQLNADDLIPVNNYQNTKAYIGKGFDSATSLFSGYIDKFEVFYKEVSSSGTDTEKPVPTINPTPVVSPSVSSVITPSN